MKTRKIETFCAREVGLTRVTTDDGAQGCGQASTCNAGTPGARRPRPRTTPRTFADTHRRVRGRPESAEEHRDRDDTAILDPDPSKDWP